MQSPSSADPSAKRIILKAWLMAGSLDILTACIYYIIRTGNSPLRVLKFVASGVFGTSAINGGMAYAVWGILLHYLVALLFTVFFFWVYPSVKWLAFNRWLTALLYGLFVWLVMNRIVLPLSNTPKSPFNLQQAVIGAAILVVMIGLPLSFVIGKYYAAKQIKPSSPAS